MNPQGSLPEENPNSLMARETMSQAHHAEYNIAKEREYEKVRQRLYEEFSKLDLNHDGMITLEEIIQFLHLKVSIHLYMNKYVHIDARTN